MADQEIGIVLRLIAQQFQNELKRSGGLMGEFARSSTVQIAAATTAAAGLAFTFHRVWESGKKGAEFEEALGRLGHQLNGTVAEAEALAASVKQASAGQLSLAESVTVSSRALAVGLAPDQIRVFTQAAEALSDVMGTDVRTAFNQILDSLVSGRTAVLGNIGVYVDLQKEVEKLAAATGRSAEEITKQERAMLAAKAVAEQAGPALAKFADGVVSDADRIAAAGKKVDDSWLAVQRTLSSLIVAPLARLLTMREEVDAAFKEAFEKSQQLHLQGPPTPEQAFIGPLAPPPPEINQWNTALGMVQTFIIAEKQRLELNQKLAASEARKAQGIISATQIEVRVREEATAAALEQQRQLRAAEDASIIASIQRNEEKEFRLGALNVQALRDYHARLDEEETAEGHAQEALGRFIVMRTQREIEANKTVFDHYKEGLDRYINDTTTAFNLGTDMARQTADAMRQGFQTFFFDAMEGRIKSFKDLLNGMLDFVKLIMAQVLAQLATGGILRGLASIPWLAGTPAEVDIPGGFQHGGRWTVPGLDGPDSRLQQFWASPGERITVETPDQMNRGKSPFGQKSAFAVEAPDVEVKVEIHNHSSAQVSAQPGRMVDGKRVVEVTIQDTVNAGFNSGVFDRTMSRNYGLNRKGTTR